MNHNIPERLVGTIMGTKSARGGYPKLLLSVASFQDRIPRHLPTTISSHAKRTKITVCFADISLCICIIFLLIIKEKE
nr:MAG TPA: hypothetical protein [Caudoviricetes sp.]